MNVFQRVSGANRSLNPKSLNFGPYALEPMQVRSMAQDFKLPCWPLGVNLFALRIIYIYMYIHTYTYILVLGFRDWVHG